MKNVQLNYSRIKRHRKMSAKIKHMSLQDKAFEALKEAVREVVREHKRTGRPLAVWQNGKAVLISPNTVK